jgi:hypothetical protein
LPLTCQREPLTETEIKKTGWKKPQPYSFLKKENSTKNKTVTSKSNIQGPPEQKPDEAIEEQPENAVKNMSK